MSHHCHMARPVVGPAEEMVLDRPLFRPGTWEQTGTVKGKELASTGLAIKTLGRIPTLPLIRVQQGNKRGELGKLPKAL